MTKVKKAPSNIKSKLVMILTVILVIVLVFGFVQISNGNKSVFSDSPAGESLEAYYQGINGNNEKLESLGITTNAEKVKEEVLNSITTKDSPLYDIFSSYYSDFSIKIVDEKEYVDYTDDTEKIDVVYEIDVYDYKKVFSEMTLDENIGDYLEEKEVDIIKNPSEYSEEEVNKVEDKFFEQYYEKLEKLDPEKKNYKLTLVKQSGGSYDFAYESSSSRKKVELYNLLYSVIGEVSVPEFQGSLD